MGNPFIHPQAKMVVAELLGGGVGVVKIGTGTKGGLGAGCSGAGAGGGVTGAEG